jgi:hypothetical protein
MSHTKTFKIVPTCFDHQIIIIRELSDPVIRFECCIVRRGMSTCRHASPQNTTRKTNDRMLPHNHT